MKAIANNISIPHFFYVSFPYYDNRVLLNNRKSCYLYIYALLIFHINIKDLPYLLQIFLLFTISF